MGGLDDLAKNITALIDSAPQPVFSAADGNHRIIQMPDVSSRAGFFYLYKSLGADQVIAYNKADFAQDAGKVDVVLDLIGEDHHRWPTGCWHPAGIW